MQYHINTLLQKATPRAKRSADVLSDVDRDEAIESDRSDATDFFDHPDDLDLHADMNDLSKPRHSLFAVHYA